MLLVLNFECWKGTISAKMRFSVYLHISEVAALRYNTLKGFNAMLLKVFSIINLLFWPQILDIFSES